MKCHNGTSNAAVVTRSDGSTYTPTDLSAEFNPNNPGFHNVLGLSKGMRETFTLGGHTFTWPVPSYGGWPVFKNGWDKDSQMTCTDCHSAVAAGNAKGPHGSSAKWMVDPAYPNDWSSTRMVDATPERSIICDKCHQYNNGVHGTPSSHETVCSACHVKIPHGWKRPRLLVLTSDPAPYNAGARMTGIRASNHSADGTWADADCATNCGGHPGYGPYIP